MKIIKDKSLKPFGSGTACLNALHGDCIRNISLEDCVKICEKSNQCDCGIYVNVKDSNLSPYCIPLNNDGFQNLNIFPSLVATENKSFLSSDKGVDTTFFYNEQVNKLPPKEVLEKIIFDFDIIQLQYQDTDGTVLTMNENFQFVKQTYFDMLFRNYWNIQYGKFQRCTNKGKYQFFKRRESINLVSQSPYNSFSWKNYSIHYEKDFYTEFFVENVNEKELFIDSKNPIYIYHQNTPTEEKNYLYVNPTTKVLSIDTKGTQKSIFYLFKSFDMKSAFPVDLYYSFNKNMTNNMETYLENFDKAYTDEKSIPVQKTLNDYNCYFVWISVAILCLLCLANIIIYIFNQKKN
jgi:hypothetical protein